MNQSVGPRMWRMRPREIRRSVTAVADTRSRATAHASTCVPVSFHSIAMGSCNTVRCAFPPASGVMLNTTHGFGNMEAEVQRLGTTNDGLIRSQIPGYHVQAALHELARLLTDWKEWAGSCGGSPSQDWARPPMQSAAAPAWLPGHMCRAALGVAALKPKAQDPGPAPRHKLDRGVARDLGTGLSR